MQALRQIRQADNESLFISVPKNFQHRNLEIIVIPIDEGEQPKDASWLQHFAGAWQGEMLVREPEGNYEDRKKLQ